MRARRNRLFTCLGCIVAGPLGCLAFVAGAAAVGTYLTPDLVASFLEDQVPDGFQEGFSGRLDVGSVELSWTRTQRVEDLVVRDPDGREVLRADVRFPPLLRVFDSEAELGETTVDLDLHLVIGEDGRTNLARAFEPKPGVEVQTSSARENAEALRGLLFSRVGTVRVRVRRFELETPRTAERDRSLRLGDLEATLTFGPGGPAELTGRDASGERRLVFDLFVPESAFDPRGADPGLRGGAWAEGFPAEVLLALLGAPPELSDVLGDEVDVALELGAADADGAPLDLSLRSGEDRLVLASRLSAPGLLSGAGERAERSLSGDLELHGGALARLLAQAELPVSLEGPGAGPVRARGLEWSSPARAPAERGEVVLELPDLVLVHDAGGRLPLADAELAVGVAAAPGDGEAAPWSVALTATLPGGGGPEGDGELSLTLVAPRPLRVLAGDPAEPFRLTATGARLALDRLGDREPLAAVAHALRGERADLRLAVGSGPERSPLELTLVTRSVRVEVAGSLAGSPFDPDDLLTGADFEADLQGLPAELLARVLPLDLEGVELDWSRSQEPVHVTFEGWRVREPAPSAPPAPPASSGGADAAPAPAPPAAPARPPGSVASAESPSAPVGSGSLSLLVPRLDVRTEDLAVRGLELALSDVAVSAIGDTDSLRIDATARIEGSEALLQERWTLYGLHGPFGFPGSEDAVLSASAQRAPTALLDAELRTGGLLGDVFGPTVDLELEGSGLAPDAGRFRLEAASPRAIAELSGFLERGAQVTDASLKVTSLLDERSVARLVLPLVPLFGPVRPAQPGDTFMFRMEEATLPLDGDPARLAGVCRIDLGPARVSVRDELRAFFVPGEVPDETAQAEGELLLRLERGRVHVHGLALPLGGGMALGLDGSYAPGGGSAELQTELPLRVVGSEVSALLHGLRDYLQPETSVPIVVRGSPSALQLSVRPQWIRTVGDVLTGLVPDVVRDNLRRLLEEPAGE